MSFSDPGESNVPLHLAAAGQEYRSIRKVTLMAPFTWVRKGVADLFVAQFASLFYGVTFALIGWTIAFFYGASYGLTLTASSAFMLVAPVLALGLYALSHQIEKGERPRLRTTLTVWRGNMANIALFALVTGVVGLIWARAAAVIFAVFYNTGLPSAGDFVKAIVAFDNIEFLVAYFGLGLLFAVFVFAISVVAIPLMYDRKTDAVTAMLLSIAVVARNPGAMLVWAALLVALVTVGFFTGFLGLIYTAPIAGHATWHAYRALIPRQED
jgi:uncharacterized membrane protein